MISMELFAVRKVEDALCETHSLSTFLSTNDKTPIWDGDIYIYDCKGKKNIPKTNKNLIGKISSQVKGENKPIVNKNINYQLERCVIKQYFHDGGTLLFVVRRKEVSDDEPAKFKIYYAELLPHTIQKILKNNDFGKLEGDKKSEDLIAVKCKVFPTKRNEIEFIIREYHDNLKRQSILRDKPIEKMYSIQELIDNDDFKCLKSSKIVISMNYSEVFSNREVIMYAETKSGFEVPVEVGGDVFISNTLEGEKVLVGNKLYSIPITVTHSSNQLIQKFGDSLTITYNKQAKTTKVDISFEKNTTLSGRIRDVEFVLDVGLGKEVSAAGLRFKLAPLKEGDRYDFEQLFKSDLAIREFLQILQIKEDLQLKTLSKEQEGTLNALVGNFINKEKLKVEKNPHILDGLHKVQFGNITVKFFARVLGDEIHLIEYFAHDNNFSIFLGDASGANHNKPSSRFMCLNKNDFISLSNINYELIFKDMTRFSDIDNLEQINYVALELISAYDECKRPEMIAFAEQLTSYLDEAITTHINEEQIDKVSLLNFRSLIIVNKFQIIKRQRTFTELEMDILWNLFEQDSLPYTNKWAIHILFDDVNSSKRAYSKLSGEEKEALVKFPIFHLYKNLIGE